MNERIAVCIASGGELRVLLEGLQDGLRARVDEIEQEIDSWRRERHVVCVLSGWLECGMAYAHSVSVLLAAAVPRTFTSPRSTFEKMTSRGFLVSAPIPAIAGEVRFLGAIGDHLALVLQHQQLLMNLRCEQLRLSQL